LWFIRSDVTGIRKAEVVAQVPLMTVMCQELRLAFIELNMNLPAYQTDKLNMAQLLEIASKYNIYYTIHLDENLNPGVWFTLPERKSAMRYKNLCGELRRLWGQDISS
jgi:hypothetical protein